MTKKIFYSLYTLAMIVGIVFVSAELLGIALPLINMASTGAVALGSLIILWLFMLSALTVYAIVRFIKKYILN